MLLYLKVIFQGNPCDRFTYTVRNDTWSVHCTTHISWGSFFFLSKILMVMIVKYDFIKFNSFNELGVKTIAKPDFKI